MLPVSADFIESIRPAAFSFEDVFGGFGPDKGFRAGVVLQQTVVDCGLQIADAAVAAYPAAAMLRCPGSASRPLRRLRSGKQDRPKSAFDFSQDRMLGSSSLKHRRQWLGLGAFPLKLLGLLFLPSIARFAISAGKIWSKCAQRHWACQCAGARPSPGKGGKAVSRSRLGCVFPSTRPRSSARFKSRLK